MNIRALLKTVAEHNASDLHLCIGLPPMLRLRGSLEAIGEKSLSNNDISEMLYSILPKEKHNLNPLGEVDIALNIDEIGRFRTNIFYERRGLSAAFRYIPMSLKSLSELGLPPVVNKCISMERGLVLVTGTTGCGKTTTLASIIDKINSKRKAHIITIEDPIEFEHPHKKSIMNQREIGTHSRSFAEALRAALREDPDVILVGEMRDLKTIAMVITAAETGHLVFSTLHTRGAAQTIDRMIDVFPSSQQDQIRVQLADVLEMVISQVLVSDKNEQKRHLACEIMVGTHAIRHHIRDKKTFQIQTAIETGMRDGMQTLDKSLKKLMSSGLVNKKDVLPWVSDRKTMDAAFL